MVSVFGNEYEIKNPFHGCCCSDIVFGLPVQLSQLSDSLLSSLIGNPSLHNSLYARFGASFRLDFEFIPCNRDKICRARDYFSSRII